MNNVKNIFSKYESDYKKIEEKNEEEEDNMSSKMNENSYNSQIIEKHEKIKNEITPRLSLNENDIKNKKDDFEIINIDEKTNNFNENENNNKKNYNPNIFLLRVSSKKISFKNFETENSNDNLNNNQKNLTENNNNFKEKKDENNKKEENKENNNNNNNIEFDMNIQKKKNKLKNSFKIEENPRYSAILLNKHSRENSIFIENKVNLPRLSSATNNSLNALNDNFILKNNSSKSIKNILSLKQNNPKINKNISNKIKLIPNPHKKTNKKFKLEIQRIEKENIYLIQELEKLNIQLTTLINKQIPNALTFKFKEKFNKNNDNEKIIENEINSSKKYLNSLINEYNNLHNQFNIGSNKKNTEKLIEKINNVKEKLSKMKKSNQNLKNKIQQNENFLKSTIEKQKNIIKNNLNINIKIKLFQEKINKLNNEIKRKEKLYDNENDKISELNNKYYKFKEILENYEETPNSLNNKIDINYRNNNYDNIISSLKTKKDILIHSRLTMKKSYDFEIDKQKRYIEDLQYKLININNLIKNSNNNKNIINDNNNNNINENNSNIINYTEE